MTVGYSSVKHEVREKLSGVVTRAPAKGLEFSESQNMHATAAPKCPLQTAGNLQTADLFDRMPDMALQ
jgi:hypothetical protein